MGESPANEDMVRSPCWISPFTGLALGDGGGRKGVIQPLFSKFTPTNSTAETGSKDLYSVTVQVRALPDASRRSSKDPIVAGVYPHEGLG